MAENNQRQYLVSMLLLIIIMSACTGPAGQRSLLVYPSGNNYLLQGQFDNRLIMKGKDAASVINHAISLLNELGGGELKLGAGHYLVESPLLMKSFTSLEGSGKATVLTLSEQNREGIVVYAEDVDHILVANLTLQGLSPVDNGTDTEREQEAYVPHIEEKYDPSKKINYPVEPSGIVFHQVGAGIIREVYARDFSSYGIWLRKDNFVCEINSCMTSGNDKAGIYMSHNNVGGRGGHSVPNLIIACKSIGEDGHAYELRRSTCNNLVGNVVYQCRGHGFYIHDHSCSNLVTGCRVFQGYRNAVYCHWAPETVISSNSFCWNRGHGIEFNNIMWGNISGNNIIDHGGVINYDSLGFDKGIAYGIYLHNDTRSAQVTGNNVFSWGDGHAPMIDAIHESENCQNNNITGNSLNFYSGKAVNMQGKNSHGADNLGIARWYSRPWEGPFMPDDPSPAQLLEPFNSLATDAVLESTRK